VRCIRVYCSRVRSIRVVCIIV